MNSKIITFPYVYFYSFVFVCSEVDVSVGLILKDVGFEDNVRM